MKKRLLAVLLCGVMLAGCGTGAERELSGEILVDDKMESAEDSKKLLIGAEEGQTEEQQKQEEDKNMVNEDEKGNQKEKMQPVPVVTENLYERAAYLTDMVYQAGDTANTMVSPLSLDMALGLVSGGAEGRTREELQNYLGRDDYGSFAEEYMKYVEELNYDSSEQAAYGGYKTVYEIANSIWVRDNRKLVEDYAKKAREQYQAEIAAVSFAPEQADKTVKRINGWCNEKTHELIPEIITKDVITEELAAILINSLYFESPWTESWDVMPSSFTNLDGTVSEQEMLKDTLECYYENEYATAFAKGYRNGMRFIGILPKKTGEFELQDLDLKTLLQSETTEYEVLARMPKLNFETTADDIVPILQAQGVEAMFSKTDADFSGLIETEEGETTYISDIIQKCKIELDEDGTRAAAVTAILVANCTAVRMPEIKEQKEVYLDRPFAFMIYDSVNEQIIFMGKVVRAE